MTKKILLLPQNIQLNRSVGPRELLYRQSYIRGFVTGSCGTGGSGKTTIIDCELASMVIGRDLLNGGAKLRCGPLNVLQMSLEDDKNELHRRRQALAKHYKLPEHELILLENNLICLFGWPKISIVSSSPDGLKINLQLICELNTIIQSRKIDVISIDPLISFHEADENSNSHMQIVLEALRNIARQNNIAVSFVHHTRKGNQKTGADDMRGAVSLRDGVRNLRVFSKPSTTEANKLGIPEADISSIVQEVCGKSNLQANRMGNTFYKLHSVDLKNATRCFPSDQIAVATEYLPPSVTPKAREDNLNAKKYMPIWDMINTLKPQESRSDPQSEEWLGNTLIAKLNLDKQAIKNLLRDWVKIGILEKTHYKDKAKNRDVPYFSLNQEKLAQTLKVK